MLVIAAINCAIAGGLFRIEYTIHRGSIEAAYISISEQILRHGFGLGWWPLWYVGIPFQNTYPPVLHVAVAGWAKLAGITAALAHHQVTAACYLGGALAVYGLAWQLSRRRTASFAAALIWSVASPSAWLIPAIRADLGSSWYPRRLNTLLVYGEGPHVTSLTLLLLALWALDRALARRTAGSMLAATVLLVLTVLSNWLGAVGLAVGVLCLLFGRPRHDWVLALAIAVSAYLLAGPWIPPSTLAAIRENAQRIGGDFRVGLPQLAGVAALLVAACAASRALPEPLLRFALPYSMVMGGITLAAEWGGVFLLPQPQRYHLEMEFGLSLAAGALVRSRQGVVLLAMAAIYPALRCAGYAREMIRPAAMEQTSEYRIARWLDAHAGGARVMAPGSVSFWLNAFTDTPQFGGGFDQGISNPVFPGVHFQILSGMGSGAAEGQVAVEWMKAFGVGLVAVGQEGTTEVFRPFANPKKFDGLLEPLWREGGDVIYRVPLRSASLARVVREGDLVREPTRYFHDTRALQPFLRALDDPAFPVARWVWLGRSEARIDAVLEPDQVLSIAVTHHPGWRATVNGRSAPIERDALGLMVVRPQCSGPCTVTLRYDGGWEQQILQVLSVTTAVGGIILAWRGVRF